MRLVLLAAVFALCACGTDSPTMATENPLGILVECDQVLEEVVGYRPPNPIVKRSKVALVPVDDPMAAAIIRCDDYSKRDGEREEPSGDPLYDCRLWSSSYWNERPLEGVTFTPNSEIYVACEETTTWPDGSSQTYGNDQVYVLPDWRVESPRAESPLGVTVQCDQTIEEVEERYVGEGDEAELLQMVRRRKVAYIPTTDWTSVRVAKCGYQASYENAEGVTYNHPGDPNCHALGVAFTGESHVVVECGKEEIYPVGWPGLSGFFTRSGYEHVYVRQSPEDSALSIDSPPGEHSWC